MTPERLAILLEKYADRSATPAEIEELNQWYRNKSYQNAEYPDDAELSGDRIFRNIDQHIHPKPVARQRHYRWYVAAATILVALMAGYWFLRPVKPKEVKPFTALQRPVVPGSNKAVLHLAGGKTINLNDAKNGQLAKQGGSLVAKSAAGVISYQANIVGAPEAVTDNTLSTPNGGQYMVALPDGTRIWLNAHSSLTFPTAFTGSERRVKLAGEAYFEVAKNPKKPFIVDVAGKQQITVLGTHFDIEAYGDDDRINTTLLEGAVRLTSGTQDLLMKPGQTAINDLHGNLKTKPADLDEVMAWKNGLFVFNDENITSVMKKVARWYDVDVEYQGDITRKRLGGITARDKSITELLDNITKTGGLHYQIKERRVILMK